MVITVVITYTVTILNKFDVYIVDFHMNILDLIFKPFKGLFSKKEEKIEVITEKEVKKAIKSEKRVYSLWDFVSFKENTQAFHIISVVGFESWIDMDEIRRRIRELFGVDYKNERSLYPYLKTLTDTNLLEINDIGGKRKWRKKQLFITIDVEKKETEKESTEEKEKVEAT